MSDHFDHVLGGTFKFHDGFQIPKVGLGISRIPTQEALDPSVDAALAAGYRLFDTAHIYNNEHFLGHSLKKFLPKYGLTRKDVFITTKMKTLNENTEENIEKHFQESLEKLQTDYVDLLLVHFPRDRDTGRDDEYEVNKRGRKIIWQKLEQLRERGVVRSIGVSNYEVYHLVELFEYAKIKPVLNQTEYQPYLCKPTLRHFCKLHNIVVQAYSSLCWGNQEILNEPIIISTCQKYNQSPQTILYAFAYNSDAGIIPKSATPSRIADNLHKTISVQLTKAELDQLYDLDVHRSFAPRCCPHKCL